jgi:hypothetical protein
MGMKNPTVLVMKNLMNILIDLDNNYWYNLDYDNDNIEPFFLKI